MNFAFLNGGEALTPTAILSQEVGSRETAKGWFETPCLLQNMHEELIDEDWFSSINDEGMFCNLL